jgi:hypothetical protein
MEIPPIVIFGLVLTCKPGAASIVEVSITGPGRYFFDLGQEL